MELIPNQKKIHMYIDGEEVVCSNQISIQEQLINTSTLTLNNCYPLSWEELKDYTQFYVPKDYSLFKMIYDYTDYDLITENMEDILTEEGQNINVGNTKVVIFAGIIKRTKSIDLNPSNPHFCDLQVLDFKTFLSEGDLFNFVIDNMTVKNAINYVISQYSGYNFIVGNIELEDKLSDMINNYNCNQKTLYDVLEYFAQITNSIWTTRYINDTTIAIDFFLIKNLPKGKDLIYNKEFCYDNSITNISYSLDSSNYRNKQIMTSDSIAGNIRLTQQFITNGKEYYLDENINSIISATLDRTNLRVATTIDEANGETADLFYTVGGKKVSFNEQVLPGQPLTIVYYPQISGRQVIIDQNEVQRISKQLNNIGVITRYENRKDADTSAELNAIGQTYIQFKGKPEINLILETINNDLYNIGDIVYFNVNDNEKLEYLQDNYMIKSKTRKIFQNNADNTNYIFYTYELNNNYNLENYINYFDNQRAKLIGNIKEGEYIDRYVENIKTFTITFNVPTIVEGD